jgi:hypothetical protein
LRTFLFRQDQKIPYGFEQYTYIGIPDTVITEIKISRQALKELKWTPQYIQEKFSAWVIAVNKLGLMETRKSPEWQDVGKGNALFV